ncbi:hypothetical protein [Actinoplanes sp. CA-252034]|uniref:hypothetical protein n=1 Tax=Actinoplanes sp. CA-252034 TaxID=3239906 RepID=UPI003D967AB2
MPDFAPAIERLLTQVHHWDEPRWRSASASAGLSRSALVQGLVQQLADLGAEAEKRPARPVPHLHDLVLRDQLRVLADDILAADPSDDLLERATKAINDTRDSLVRT